MSASVYQQATIEYDADTATVAVPEQPDGSVLIAFNTDTLGGLLRYSSTPIGDYSGTPTGDTITRDEALPIFVSLMGRDPAPGEL